MKIILIKGAAFPPYNLGHPVDGNPIEVNDDLGQKLINAKIAITEAQAKGEAEKAEKAVEVDDSTETTTAKEKEDAEKAEKKGEATETATAKGPANAEKAVAPKAPKAKK